MSALHDFFHKIINEMLITDSSYQYRSDLIPVYCFYKMVDQNDNFFLSNIVH